MNDPPRLVLASRSPRRAQLLTRLGLDFVTRVVDIDESLAPDEDVEAAARRLARSKARAGVEAGELAIGCDTLVAHRGAILEKPRTPEEAIDMIGELQGGEHRVYTGVALADVSRVESAVEMTRVWFRSLDSVEVQEYVATREPMDKAGAYGIQGFGAAIVRRIEGDYFNVMGLPIQRLLELFRRFGWRYAFGRLSRLGEDSDEPRS